MKKELMKNRERAIIVLVSLFLCLTTLQASEFGQFSDCFQIIPESWTPSLDQVAQAIEESSKEDRQASQQVLNRTSQNLADIRDAQLFIAYVQLMQSLNTQGKTELFDEQKRWLNQRDEKARASVVSKGGTLASLEYSDAFRQFTEERLAELKARLLERTQTK
ncbi:protein of unknown function DUF1311 [Nitrosomonas sp. Is79A3]|uniref:lysozyme inhibitor LprI family protein n=1 Tax=Nitrosomonas sp. (strain Is79A3) TaxID=261292 RepID=UPI000215C751